MKLKKKKNNNRRLHMHVNAQNVSELTAYIHRLLLVFFFHFQSRFLSIQINFVDRARVCMCVWTTLILRAICRDYIRRFTYA